jgi:hypothetical protein
VNLFSHWQKSPYFRHNGDVVRQGLCRRLWPSGARSGAMSLLATSWATLRALVFLKFEPGGEFYDTFNSCKK